MTSAPTSLESSAFPASRLSRRQCLGLATAGLAAPLLQACGGGGSGTSAFLSAPPDAESVRWCREAILKTLNRSDSATTAVSVALLADNRVVWREAFGQANRETGLPAAPDTRFNIGSVAKVFAALAVMVLRDRGQLALDQPVVELLPAFGMRSGNFKQITVRHLISHSSGVPGVNFRNVFNFAPIPGYAQDTLQSLALSRMKHEPGELAVYCNDGFTMVELLVLQLSGLSYPAFIQREFFDPLGMSLSGFALAPAAEGTFVHPFYNGRTLSQEMPAAYATGGTISTPTDMMKLARMFLDAGVYEGRRIVSAESIRDMGVDQARRTRIDLTPTFRVGLGWDTVKQLGMEAAGLRAWLKNGGTTFFASEFIVLPEARLAMMITGNGFDYGSLALTEGLLLRTAAERGAIQAMPAAIVPILPPAVSPGPDRAAMVGIYANHSAPAQVLAADDGSLTVRSWGEAGWTTVQAQLRARTDGRWWSDGQPSVCYRFQTMEGRRYLIRRSLSDNQLYWNESPVGEWLPALDAPLPPAWQARRRSRWLSVNDDPASVEVRLGPRIWLIDELAEMPGYVLWDNAQLLRVIDDNEAGMTIKVPVNAGRELVELRMVMVNGQEEMHSGTLVFQRMAT